VQSNVTKLFAHVLLVV
jgi:hypothetical protein